MHPTLLDEVLSCPSLPSLPTVAISVLEKSRDPNVTVPEIGKLVRQDQALSAKVLKTINSSYYGLSKPVTSIERAAGYLGMNTIKSLVLGFSLVETAEAVGDGFDLDAHWRRALYSAAAAERIAKSTGVCDADEAFTAGLFQDIGMLAAFTALGSRYLGVLGDGAHTDACECEHTALGFDHAEAGGGLAQKWKLPDSLTESVRWHHNPDRAASAHRDLVRVVHLSMLAAETLWAEKPGAVTNRFIRHAKEWFGDRLRDLPELLNAVSDAGRTLAKLFDQQLGETKDVRSILAEAQDASLEHQLSLQRQAEDAAIAAVTDGLTGCWNRKKFDADMERHYQQWKQDGTDIALAFFDADRFKSVNDTHGHAAGDAVLVELARRTREIVGDRGIVCRYGGEEFGVILPGMTNAEAADLAETIRAGIESPPFDLSALDGVPNELKVTVSIGVSAADAAPPKRLVNAEKLVQEADAAVYAAKKGGRNNVKVWGRLRNEDLAADSVSAPRVEPKQTAHAEGLRVLLIEDDALSALLVRSLLKQKPGVEVEWIGSGTEAIDRLTARDADRADVVIADFHLDGIVASELMRLASRGPCAGVPFLIITSSDEPSVREKCFGAGAVGFITKQQLAKELNKWVGTVIETARAQNSQAAGGSPGTRAA